MGYYIQLDKNHNKAEQLAALYDGRIIPRPRKFSDIPTDKALVVVVDNGAFEAAGLAFDLAEFQAFLRPDHRPRKYVLIDKHLAYKLSGYAEDTEVA